MLNFQDIKMKNECEHFLIHHPIVKNLVRE